MLGTYTGVNDTLEVGNDHVALVSNGLLSFLTSNPSRKVAYNAIRGVVLHPCSLAGHGSLRIALSSGVDGLGVLFTPAPMEDIVFVFSKDLGGPAGVDGANGAMAGVKRFIDDRAARPAPTPPPAPPSGAASGAVTVGTSATGCDGLGSELERLVRLRERGELTRDEFELAKRRVLGK